jgi:membrane-associated phospholipid phosphatase
MIRTCDVRPGLGHARRPIPWPPHLAVHRPVHVAAGTWRRLIKETFLIATFAVIYEEIRVHMVQAGAAAASHALLVVSAERTLGLFHERAVQDAIIGNDTVTDAFNSYYGGTHFLIPILVLAWLLFRHPAHYARARTALAVITGLAFIVFWLFPVAPPRLLPGRFGIVDTLVAGSGHVESALISAAGDQYASMPSVHVAWAVWCALAIYPVARHWAVRVLAIAYPLVTTLVVVSTGNHFFLDVIAGALLAIAAWIAVTRIGSWLTVRIATRRTYRQPGRRQPVGARPALADSVPGSAPGGLPEDLDDGVPARRITRRRGEPDGPPEENQIAA